MNRQKGIAPILIVIIISVAVGGYLIYSNYSNNRTKTTTVPQQSIQPSPSADETTNWKTYTNKYLTFEYPASWNLDSTGDTSVSLSTTRSTTDKAGGDYTPGMGWLNFYISNDPVQKVIDSTSGVEKTDQGNINGAPYTRLIGHSGVGGSVYFVNIIMNSEGRTYVVNLSTQDANLEELLTLELDQILSTFKFLDQSQTDTSNWKTYKNDQFNFELKLPGDVQIKEKQAGSNTIRFSNVYKWEDKEIDPDIKQYLDIFLFVSIVDPQIDLKDWISKDATRPMPSGKIESQIKGEIQKYKQGSIDGYWYVGVVEEEDKYIVFKKDNRIFKFRLNGYQTGSSYKDNPNAETILDQMLSTFKFTP